MKLGNKLLEVRENAGISRSQLSDFLLEKGFDVKPYTIGKWETGVSNPSVEAFLAICDICKVSDIQQTFGDKRSLRLYDISVSAGCGNYLNSSDYDVIDVDNTVPATADYAVRVVGDSMMPRFVDKQIIFVHEQPSLEDGEIGIFCLNNEAYLKKLDKGYLVSLNPKYSPIPVKDFDDLRIFGKVVG